MDKNKMRRFIENQARELSKHIFKSEYKEGTKASIHICGFTPLSTSEEVICPRCGRVCYRDKKLLKESGFINKNAEIICGICALKYYKNELTALEIEILKKAYGKYL